MKTKFRLLAETSMFYNFLIMYFFPPNIGLQITHNITLLLFVISKQKKLIT